MKKEEALDILRKSGAMLEGHFRLTSGLHSNRYMQCAQLFKSPEYSRILCEDLVKKFEGTKIDLVVGPAMGGMIMAYEVARQMGVPNIFAERENGVMTFRRGFKVPEGAKVLITEDVVTTGGSVREVMKLVEEAGAEVVAVGVGVDRSEGAVDFGVPMQAVLSMKVEAFKPEECPLCKEGTPVVKPGSRPVK